VGKNTTKQVIFKFAFKNSNGKTLIKVGYRLMVPYLGSGRGRKHDVQSRFVAYHHHHHHCCSSKSELETIILTNVCFLESRRVVDPVSRDGYYGSLSLTSFNNNEFLLRWRASKHDLRVVSEHVVNLCWSHITQITAVYHTRLRVPSNQP